MSKASRRAARDLAKKIKLENRIKPKLRTLFRQMAKDVRSVWRATGRIANLDSYTLDMTALLREHYRAVSRQFNSGVVEEAKSANLFLEKKQEEDVDAEIALYILEHSTAQAAIILGTTQNELNRVIGRVITENINSDAPVPSNELGPVIENEFRRDSLSRVDTIAMTETQTTSESVKLITATGVATSAAAQVGVGAPARRIFKTWNTVLDEKTRASHAAADRQRVPVNEAFIVQGQRLMVPGDTSLGATVDNIINCRCSAVYNFEGQESPPLDTPRQLL